MMERLKALKDDFDIGMLNKVGHANFCMRCLTGLPGTMTEADPSRVAVGFYCLGALDILGHLETKVSETDREAWRAWIWAQQVGSKSSGKAALKSVGKDVDPDESRNASGVGGLIGGFRPGPFMHVGLSINDQAGSESTSDVDVQECSNAAREADPPHLIMTYTALLSLAILRDDFTNLGRESLINFLRSTQKPDGSFTAFPGQGESDIRMVYTAFAISAMLDDWRGVDVPSAIAFTKRCMSYEGGFGQVPGNEAQGGSSYCALATLALAPAKYGAEAQLNTRERKRLERWLVQKQKPRQVYISYEEEEEEDISILAPQPAQPEPRIQDDAHEGGNGEVKNDKKVKVKEVVEEEGGGFAGRTEKTEDACYSFWCGAALRILRSGAIGGGRSSPSTLSQANDIISSSAFAAADNVNEDVPQQRQEVRREEGVHSALEGGGEVEFIDRLTHARFISRCQFRLGGLGKAPGAHPDPYHTYLALAALALYPPPPYQSPRLHRNHLPPQTNSTLPSTSTDASNSTDTPKLGEEEQRAPDWEPSETELLEEMKVEKKRRERETWRVRSLDPLINATEETTRWAREKISQRVSD